MKKIKCEVKARLKKIIKDHMGRDAEDDSTFDDLGCDSLDLVELVMACEEEFGIEIPDADAEKVKTFEQALSYLKNRTGESYGA